MGLVRVLPSALQPSSNRDFRALLMPKKKPSLGRAAKSSGKSKQKRNRTTEVLAAEIAVLQQQLANNKAELELLHGRMVATLGGLTGTHRRRASFGAAPADEGDDVGDDETPEPTVESLVQRDARLSEEINKVRNHFGRSRTYHENRTLIFACLKVEKDVLSNCTDEQRPKLKDIAIRVAGLMGYDTAFAQRLMANWRLDGSILVHETQERGKGSSGYASGRYIDTARRLAPEHLKAMEEFRRQCHADGGVVSVRTVCQHLNETFGSDDADPNGVDASAVAAGAAAAADAQQLNSDSESDSQAAASSGLAPSSTPPKDKGDKVFFTRRAVRYAMREYLGWSWGRIRPRKSKGDLDRRDVIVAYLRDFGRALKLERAGKAVLVYTDESYIHQNHCPRSAQPGTAQRQVALALVGRGNPPRLA